ncbi:MAG: DUF4198 domain-containing protein [Pseudomonadota bacterium]
MKTLLSTLVLTVVLSIPAQAHEFWIEPEPGIVANGDEIVAALRVGQELSGASQSYLPRQFKRFEVFDDLGMRPVEGRLGDRPAMTISARTGLTTAILESSTRTITWRKSEDFLAFLEYDGLQWVEAAHEARGLPADGFKEHFRRHAKALIETDVPAGADAARGLPLEIVTATNPFTDDGPLSLQALWQGAPIADLQLAHFHRDANDAVTRTLYRFDAAGQLIMPRPAPGFSLLSVVHMEPIEAGEAVWLSHWASLTFHVGSP